MRGALLEIAGLELTSGYSSLQTALDVTSGLKIEIKSIIIYAAMPPNVSMNLIRMEITLAFTHGKSQHFDLPVHRPQT